MNQKRKPRPVIVNVGTITSNSGVYISEQNLVCGISSHSKSNNGLGSIGSSNLLRGNISLVYDSDFIDTPIDDRDVKIYQENQTSSTAETTQVGFDSINVATMAQNSGIFVGDVKITGLDAHSKQNNATGTTYGHRNVDMQNLNYVYDSDAIDTPIYDQDIKLQSR
ncbi:hypothetical protein NZD89_07660 [Alicyclobacillus fastidiosus]|uniref:Spore germination protein GerPA/GerPF n=1 Tax=Alicyclobacillus fastidiosus TaxID=392011 RepID=A0ABY6ZK75_9BACL|nr:hypothetical protein [Alicyclobacillus fastidiosus]WAH43261.1 hypothetical protein NZD89_07660 [Alicyclobacillus fastidiosus]GMA65308.1 hypothetical protein GCM10025859_57480 [Alicyclobacillus fastidiosus]